MHPSPAVWASLGEGSTAVARNEQKVRRGRGPARRRRGRSERLREPSNCVRAVPLPRPLPARSSRRGENFGRAPAEFQPSPTPPPQFGGGVDGRCEERAKG